MNATSNIKRSTKYVLTDVLHFRSPTHRHSHHGRGDSSAAQLIKRASQSNPASAHVGNSVVRIDELHPDFHPVDGQGRVLIDD